MLSMKDHAADFSEYLKRLLSLKVGPLTNNLEARNPHDGLKTNVLKNYLRNEDPGRNFFFSLPLTGFV